MKTLNILFGLIILISCADNNPAKTISALTSSTTNPVTEEDYLRTRDRTIQYLKNHIYSNGQYKGNESELLKLENDSCRLLENQLRQILTNSRITNLSKEGKLNLEALSEGLGFGLLDGLKIKNGNRTTFCTSKSLFLKYFGNKIANKLDDINPTMLENIFQSSLYSEVSVKNYSTIKLNSPKGTNAYGMVAFLGQEIGAYSPQVVLILYTDMNYIYMIEDPIEIEFKEISKCRLVWDSISSLSEKQFNKYKESSLQDTGAFSERIRLEEKAWEEHCNCYRTELPKDTQFTYLKRQMDSLLVGLW